MHDAFLDLILGSLCLGCGQPGKQLCRVCRDGLPSVARLAWPTPTPAGLAPPWTSAEFSGTTRALVLALKERSCFSAARPLGQQLAQAVLAAAHDAPNGRIVLVPVPSRRSTVRQRGHDSTHTVTRRAALELRGNLSAPAIVSPLLALRSGVVDQSELTASARASNVTGSMFVPSERLSRLMARTRDHVVTIVCDDVLTTGSTAREAQRALEAVGLPVAGIATVAATRRKLTTVQFPTFLSPAPLSD